MQFGYCAISIENRQLAPSVGNRWEIRRCKPPRPPLLECPKSHHGPFVGAGGERIPMGGNRRELTIEDARELAARMDRQQEQWDAQHDEQVPWCGVTSAGPERAVGLSRRPGSSQENNREWVQRWAERATN